MNSGYLDYLEHSPDAALTAGALLRLAAALETTPEFLRAVTSTGRPVPGEPARTLISTSSAARSATCSRRRRRRRFVFLAPQGPVALPVNFRYQDGDVLFRTRPTGALATAAGTTVSLEVDQIDEPMSEGWSVLVTGARGSSTTPRSWSRQPTSVSSPGRAAAARRSCESETEAIFRPPHPSGQPRVIVSAPFLSTIPQESAGAARRLGADEVAARA